MRLLPGKRPARCPCLASPPATGLRWRIPTASRCPPRASRSGKFRDHGCVVGGPFEFARGLVNRGGGATLRHFSRDQDMVDAQAGIAPEAEHPVVPPGINLLRLLEQAE